MADQEPVVYDYQSMQMAFQTVKQLGEQVKKLGTTMTSVHEALQEHLSGDESGVGAVVAQTASDFTGVAGKVFTEAGRVVSEMGVRGHANSDRMSNTDDAVAKAFQGIHDEHYGDGRTGGGNGSEPPRGPSEPGAPGEPGSGPVEPPNLDGDPQKAKDAEPTSRCTKAGEPVDVVSGQMLIPTVDLELPGLLPLVLYRVYASRYRNGRWFGASWSSTLDQHVEFTADGLVFRDDDGAVQEYPAPLVDGPSVLPFEGAQWPLAWDRASDTIRITDPDTGRTRHFAAPSDIDGASASYGDGDGEQAVRPITAITDRNGHRIDIDRDAASGAPTAVRHSGGYHVTIETVPTHGGTRIAALRLATGPEGAVATVVEFGYDERGRLNQIRNESGQPLVYEYDDADRIVSWTDRLGFQYRYEYDQAGRVIRGIGDGGVLSSTFEYDDAARTTTVTDSLGNAMSYHWDERFRVVKTIDPNGAASLTEYDRLGRVTAYIDEIGRTTRYVLDEHGQPLRVERPDGSTLELTYTPLRQLATLAADGRTLAAFEYDDRGNLLSLTDAAGSVERREYDEAGRPVSMTDALGRVRRFLCNPAGLIVQTTDAIGRTGQTEYDAFGNPAVFRDPEGGELRLTWRIDGQLAERVLRDGTREQWRYDVGGNPIEYSDAMGAVTRFEYGPFGTLTARTDPDGVREELAYDTEQQLSAVRFAGGASWTYRYDAAGHLVGQTDFNGRSLIYRNDAADQLTEITDGSGLRTTFEYNALGDVVRRQDADGSVTEFEYDERGFLVRVATADSTIEYTRDVRGRVLSETVDGLSVSYLYDEASRCTSRITPSGVTTTATYDAADQLLSVSGASAALRFEYDRLGLEVGRRLGRGAVLRQSWDDLGRLRTQSLLAGAEPEALNPVQERTFRYRADSYPVAIVDRLRGRRELELSPTGRVTRVAHSGTNIGDGVWTEQYAYDPLGNISRTQIGGAGAESPAAGERTHTGTLLREAGRYHYEYDERSRLVRRVARTLSGQRLEWRYAWNDQDQLIRLTTPRRGTWTYRYDPLGRRIAKRRVDPADQDRVLEEYTFAWDGVRLAEQTHVEPDGTRRTVTWDWSPGSWRALSQTERIWRGEAGQGEYDELFFAIVTGLGDAPGELVTPDGRIAWTARTDLWGRRLPSDGRDHGYCPLGLPGQYHDAESGLEYNYFRYYDPETGRYLTPDPLGREAGPNPHAYVPNPLVWIDPYGLAKRVPKGEGGAYTRLTPANFPPTHARGGQPYEINHMPAQASYKGILNLGTDAPWGPSIRMEYDDHRRFISTGSDPAAVAWRAKQRDLILQGKFDVAMKMDIGKIRKEYGTKYDAAIKEMVDSLPSNKRLQDELNAKGWKIRYCLLG
jgi:RHS repeat-associated protein